MQLPTIRVFRSLVHFPDLHSCPDGHPAVPGGPPSLARRLSLKGFGVGVSAGPLGVALMPDTAWPAVSPPDGPFQALMVAI